MRKFCFAKSHISKTQQLEKSLYGFVWESRTPRFILVLDLCSFEVYIASLRYRIRISIEGKSWIKMEYGIFVPKYAVFQNFSNFWL